MAIKNIDDLIILEKAAFKRLERDKLDNFFKSLQKCMENIMMTNRNHFYKIRQIN